MQGIADSQPGEKTEQHREHERGRGAPDHATPDLGDLVRHPDNHDQISACQVAVRISGTRPVD